jgi:CheY-like chemotaxis protein
MDGIEAMITIKKENPTLPILLSSGYAEDEFSFNKEQQGVNKISTLGIGMVSIVCIVS